MTRAGSRRRERAAVELIEEAVQLLRLCPPGVLAAYYAGSVPFLLGLLYFWADMSRSAAAPGRLAGSAFGLALLFAWMKGWHAVFGQALLARLVGAERARGSLRRAARAAAEQAAVQATGLFLLPAAAVAALPLGWAYAFYQNASILGGGDGGTADLLRRSWRQANLWPRQNHLLLAVFLAFGAFIFVDLAIALAAAPWIVKTLSGTETLFAAGPWLVLNTTFLAAVAGMTWLCVDPLLKSAYALRCFYGESLETGDDLRAELRAAFPGDGRAIATVLLVVPVLLLLLAVPARAAGTGAPGGIPAVTRPAAAAIDPAARDRSIDEVMRRKEFAWRAPRSAGARQDDAGEGLLSGFLEDAGRFLRKAANTFVDWVKKVIAWFRKLLPEPTVRDAGRRPLSEIAGPVQALLFTLLAIVAAVAGVAAWRAWRRRGVPKPKAEADGAGAAPDLAAATVKADDLPADGWLSLARDLHGRGEGRLALRALHLAGLAHLGRLGVVDLATAKSNGDYERELRRKARGAPDLVAAFSGNTASFDRAWYGTHGVDAETYALFSRNLERILSHAPR